MQFDSLQTTETLCLSSRFVSASTMAENFLENTDITQPFLKITLTLSYPLEWGIDIIMTLILVAIGFTSFCPISMM